MANKNGYPIAPTVQAWFQRPLPQYVPLADVAFAPPEIVLPHQLPPQSMQFAAPWANKMLNIPSVAVIFNQGRTGRLF